MKRTLTVSAARRDTGVIHTTILNLADLTQHNQASVMLVGGTILDLRIVYEVKTEDA